MDSDNVFVGGVIDMNVVCAVISLAFAIVAIGFVVDSKRSNTKIDRFLKVILSIIYWSVSGAFIFVPEEFVIIPAVLGVVAQFFVFLYSAKQRD